MLMTQLTVRRIQVLLLLPQITLKASDSERAALLAPDCTDYGLVVMSTAEGCAETVTEITQCEKRTGVFVSSIFRPVTQ